MWQTLPKKKQITSIVLYLSKRTVITLSLFRFLKNLYWLFANILQEALLHSLPGDWDETNWAVALLSLSSSFWIWANISLFPAIGSCLWLLPFRVYTYQSYSSTSQLTWHLSWQKCSALAHVCSVYLSGPQLDCPTLPLYLLLNSATEWEMEILRADLCQ